MTFMSVCCTFEPWSNLLCKCRDHDFSPGFLTLRADRCLNTERFCSWHGTFTLLGSTFVQALAMNWSPRKNIHKAYVTCGSTGQSHEISRPLSSRDSGLWLLLNPCSPAPPQPHPQLSVRFARAEPQGLSTNTQDLPQGICSSQERLPVPQLHYL